MQATHSWPKHKGKHEGLFIFRDWEGSYYSRFVLTLLCSLEGPPILLPLLLSGGLTGLHCHTSFLYPGNRCKDVLHVRQALCQLSYIPSL